MEGTSCSRQNLNYCSKNSHFIHYLPNIFLVQKNVKFNINRMPTLLNSQNWVELFFQQILCTYLIKNEKQTLKSSYFCISKISSLTVKIHKIEYQIFPYFSLSSNYEVNCVKTKIPYLVFSKSNISTSTLNLQVAAFFSSFFIYINIPPEKNKGSC